MVLEVGLFEVDIVETVVLLEYFSDVGLPHLLQITVEILFVKVFYEILDCFGDLDFLLGLVVMFLIKIEFESVFEW